MHLLNKLFLSQACILFLLTSANLLSQEVRGFDVKKSGQIIILDEGRKKPLHSYAQKKLIQFSGRKSISGKSALEWLLELMLYPGAADTSHCFKITNSDVTDALGIQGGHKKRYSYTELYAVIDKCESIAMNASRNPDNLLPYQRDILQLWNNIQEYNAIGMTFSAFDQYDPFTIRDSSLAVSLNLELNKAYSFSEMIKLSSLLSSLMKNIENLGSLSATESELIRLVKTMHSLRSQLENKPPFIMPVSVDGTVQWQSPGEYISKFGSTALIDKRMESFLDLKHAYLRKDASAFSRAVDELTLDKYEDVHFPKLEILYNELNLFFICKLLFAAAGIFSLFGIFYTRLSTVRLSFILTSAGLLIHTVGLLMRILIQMRPPLASLYETFVFVAWVIVILGMLLELFQRRGTGMLISSFGGFLFLFISGRYTMYGDTFGVLSAVLNSGFWLTTHIVTISTGYAGCIIAGLLGHVYLIQRAKNSNDMLLKSTDSAVYGFMLLGLAFTIAGTVLGGMWADQAWGRFWGWDPKENGALLIILWTSTVIHARKGKLIGPGFTSAGAIAGILMVMLAWVGVNLLGVGLHSYGFTYSGLGLLAGTFFFEFVFLIVIAIIIGRKKRFLSPAPLLHVGEGVGG